MTGLLGKKVGMTHIFDENGHFIPVTVISAGPCQVLGIRTKERNGYDAVQIGFGEAKAGMHDGKKVKSRARYVRELKVKDPANYKQGQKLEADIFVKGDFVDVVGTSIGKGFQGGVKRWGWSGGDQGHGSMFHRAVGSIQSGARLARVTKGHHMPGHMGNARITVQNLEVVDIDKANNLIAVKGAVPGHREGLLIIKEARKRPKGYVKHKVPLSVTPKKGAKALKPTKK